VEAVGVYLFVVRPVMDPTKALVASRRRDTARASHEGGGQGENK
jgi:hypothetical protein